MNKSILASMLIPALLSGCGGSSGGTAIDVVVTPITYKWQIVQLASVIEADLDDSCVIYADSKNNTGEVISAYIAETGYNILYHNEDGSIATTYSSADVELDNGLLTINADDVPDDGYVTLEELANSRGDKSSYMFSVEKSLLSDMVLNISAEQTGSCYAGTDYRKTISKTAQVNVSDKSSVTQYYQSSYDFDLINGAQTSSYIPVDSPYPAEHDILVTAYDTYDPTTEQKTDLISWAFIDAGNLYETSEDDGYSATKDLSNVSTSIDWSSSDTVSLDSASGIIAVHDDISYFWQPIYDTSNELTYAYGSEDVSLWSAYFSGTEGNDNLLFSSFIQLPDDGTDIALPVFPALVSIDTMTVSSSCSLAAEFCINTDSGFSRDDFDYQRIHIRLEEDDNGDTNTTYQSIYSKANIEPVVLVSSNLAFDTPTLTRIELNIMSSDASSSDAVQYLMMKNMDLVNVGEYDSDSSNDTAETAFYSDINGFIATDTQSDTLYQALLESTTTIVMAAH